MEAAERRARHQRVEAGGEPAGVHDMEAVDVLGRIDGRDHLGGVDLPGQRQLNEDSINVGIGVQLADELEQLVLGDGRRQIVREAGHSGFGGRAVLRADVDGARRILADQDRREPGCAAGACFEFTHSRGDPVADRLGGGFSVDPLRRHPPR